MISIGEQFYEARKAKNLTLEEVSRATKIREEFLRSIEKGNYEKLPGPSYAHGFVRNYAKFLGLSEEKSLALFRREYDEKKNVEVLPQGLVNSKEYSKSRIRIGRSIILIAVVFLIIASFLFYQYRSAIFNPALSVEYPKEGAVLSSITFEVKGKTDPNATLTIDNRQVTIEPDGGFKKQVTVFPGSTSITIRVENQFGKVTTLRRNITVK